MTLLNLSVYLSNCMALVQLVGSVISTNCYTPPAVGIVEEGREEVADEALNQLKNDLDEASGRNQELLKENMKLLEKEGALRQRIDELQKVLILQEVDHRHQLAVLREEAEDQAAKMKDLHEEVNGALGGMVIEIDQLKADNARKAVKLATGEKELLALQGKANGAEAENSRLKEIIADYERRLLQVPQEEDIADLKCALGWMVIEIDRLKADNARKAVKLATGEKILLALQGKANGAEAENSRLREVIADYERRLLQVPQEEDIAALKFDVALKEREIAEVRRALDEESRRNIILQSQIETLKSRVSKQEENGDENARRKLRR
ncbi:coiled-coil domain-containing protein 102A-like [Macrobrachium nipponense]|uniref:coiled-coil domain-containing protein 102A-like n=1 Tax=Macrobrachium nipponense TaxID=159736 RepID=UPI0030C7EC79